MDLSPFIHQQPKNTDGKQRKSDHQQASDCSAIKGGLESTLAVQNGALSRTHIGQDCHAHPNVTGAKRTNCTEHEPCGSGEVTKNPQQQKDHGGYGANGDDLAVEVGLRPFLNGTGDLEHPLVSRGERDHLFDKEDSSTQAKKAAQEGEDHAYRNKKSR
jgi:hypothetical protein